MSEPIEVGYVFDISSGTIIPKRYVMRGEKTAWGIGADGRSNWTVGQWAVGKDLFTTPEQAIAAGKAARDKRLKSLQKQIERLQKMAFELAPNQTPS